MKIRCIAVDDEPPALSLVQEYIRKTPFLELMGAHLNPLEALNQVSDDKIELVFMDINMPDVTGLQLSKMLPDDCKVIFTTAYEQYALEGFKVSAVDYLVKPFDYEEFMQACLKAKEWIELKRSRVIGQMNLKGHLMVRADYQWRRIAHNDLLFIKGEKDYVQFHLAEGKPVMSLMSLKSLEEELPSANFMRIHRSYIVNLDQVKVIERNRIVFGEHYLPIGDAFKDRFFETLNRK